jgi:hypothetical protein
MKPRVVGSLIMENQYRLNMTGSLNNGNVSLDDLKKMGFHTHYDKKFMIIRSGINASR